MHVSGGEDAGNIGSVVVRPFFGQDSPAGGKLYAEGPGCIGLTACKAGCDQQNITGNDLLSSCKLAEFSVLELYLNGTDFFQDTFFQNQLPDSCPEDPGINAVAGDGFHMAIVNLEGFRPFGPGIRLGAHDRWSRHHLDGSDTFAFLPQNSTDAVVAGVSSAHDDDVLSLCSGVRSTREQGFGAFCQKVHCKIDAFHILDGFRQPVIAGRIFSGRFRYSRIVCRFV